MLFLRKLFLVVLVLSPVVGFIILSDKAGEITALAQANNQVEQLKDFRAPTPKDPSYLFMQALKEHRMRAQTARVLIPNCSNGALVHQLGALGFNAEALVQNSDLQRLFFLKSWQVGRKQKIGHAFYNQKSFDAGFIEKMRIFEYDIVILNLQTMKSLQQNPNMAALFDDLLNKVLFVFILVPNNEAPDTFETANDWINRHGLQNAVALHPEVLKKGEKKYWMLRRKYVDVLGERKLLGRVEMYHPDRGKPCFLGNDWFAKYTFYKKSRVLRKKVRTEQKFYEAMGKIGVPHVPEPIAFGSNRDYGTIALKRIHGRWLLEDVVGLEDWEKKVIIRHFIETSGVLEKGKLCHADVTLKNIVWDRESKKSYLIDFERGRFNCAPEVREVLTLAWEMHHGKALPRHRSSYPVKVVSKDLKDYGVLGPLVKPILEERVKTYAELLPLAQNLLVDSSSY